MMHFFSVMEDIVQIKDLLIRKGAKIAMNVLKIALNKEEEKLARYY